MNAKSFCAAIMLFCAASLVSAADLYIGAASVDITPDKPVLLQGQFNTRIARTAETPITANIIALESRDGDSSLARAVFVALDCCSVQQNVSDRIFAGVKAALPDFSPEEQLILSATHTHTSIATGVDGYALPEGVRKEEILMEDAAADFIASKVIPGIVEAWNTRVKGKYAFGLGSAVVAFNRRSVYENGEAKMYGETNDSKFRKIEGMEDHDVGCVFFWDESDKLRAMIVNPSCPSQEVEGRSAINADYWHPVRQRLHAVYGDDVVVAGVCGAAGDLSPHVRYRAKAHDRMTALRHPDVNIEQARLNDIARRIATAVDEVYPVVEPTKTADCPLVHRYEVFDVPQQKVPTDLYEKFKVEMTEIKAKMDTEPAYIAQNGYVRYNWTKRVVERYEQQQGVENPTYKIGSHFVRIGETVFATNPFELYTDFGVQMKARSKATQTFIVQLCTAVEKSGYVPSAYAVAGGGYGAIPQSNYVGAEGGQIFTDKSIEIINTLFE